MPDYQKMYTLLFNATTDAILRLQRAQQEAEELYLTAEEPLRLADYQNDEENTER